MLGELARVRDEIECEVLGEGAVLDAVHEWECSWRVWLRLILAVYRRYWKVAQRRVRQRL
jgi:hypothetical protein